VVSRSDNKRVTSLSSAGRRFVILLILLVSQTRALTYHRRCGSVAGSHDDLADDPSAGGGVALGGRRAQVVLQPVHVEALLPQLV